MLERQRQEARKIDANLKRLSGVIRDKREELTGLRSEIADAKQERQRQKNKAAIELRALERTYHDRQVALEEELGPAQHEVEELAIQKKQLADDLDSIRGDITQLRADLATAESTTAERREELRLEIINLEGSAESARAGLAKANEAHGTTARRLQSLRRQSVGAYVGMVVLAADLRASIREMQTHLRRLEERAREYEEGMRVTRENDTLRAEELDRREARLKAQQRALNQEKQDFEARKRRFHQLKEMQ